MSLGNLPTVRFAELDPALVEGGIIAAYERISGKTLYPSDPVRLFLSTLAYTLSVQNNLIDLSGRQNLLAYAQGAHLDHLGALMDTPRLAAANALVSLRFTLPEPLDWPVFIAAGTRVGTGLSSGGGLVFAVERGGQIEPGALYIDLPARCLEPGASANGLLPGQINRMVDPLPYVTAVANISTSGLGADPEADEPYRRRIQLAPEKFTVAGPRASYRYHALSAHPDIADVAVWRPQPGYVDVRPIMSGGELPTQDLLDAVSARLNDERVRPLTDTVIVAAPEPVQYSVDAVWYLSGVNAALSEIVRGRVADALEDYRVWQRSQPGRDINPTRLIALLERAGAKRVELTSPAFVRLEARQIARESEMRLIFGGVEDE